MSIRVEDMIATTEQAEEGLLGNLFWYSVSLNTNKEISEIRKGLIETGLGEDWMPNSIRPVDAFRRATREIQQRKPTANPKIFENFLVREVYSDPESIQRNVVVETVDQGNKKLGYEAQSGIIRLDKKTGAVSFETDNEMIRELCREAEIMYNDYCNHYTSNHIRTMITNIMSSLAPTPMRPNGIIYFIPNSRSEDLAKLVHFIRKLDDSEAFQVPVIDSNDNRHMVTKKLTDHLESLSEQCRNGMDMRKHDKRALIQATNKAIKDFKEYEMVTSAETKEFRTRIVSLRSEVAKLLSE